jgi:NAD(P)H-quinone oxidoreductase subunit 5
MEGPTPTSAIFYGALSIHLGAFLLLRLNPIVQLSPILAWTVVFFGLLTALVSGIIANAQTDIKSILAYATLTQVGIIIAEIGFGLELLPLIHIIGHASLRTYQFLRAPSSFAYYKSLEESLGRTDLNRYTPKGRSAQTGPLSLAIYCFALNRGGMDSMLEKFITKPFVQMFKLADIFEKKWGSVLAGIDTSKTKNQEERS